MDTTDVKGARRRKNTTLAPAVPADVIRKVRIGSTIALLLAAGISARTLFQLGQIIGLPKSFAWMLPGAFDVYAYTSATVAASIPAAHPARGWAVWNARVALSFTMVGNSLVHALYLMSHGQRWTGTDYALVAVSAIPPIIVERLLHLQTKIATDAGADSIGTPVGADGRTQVPTKPRRPEVPTAPTGADRSADGSAVGTRPSAPPVPMAPTPGADEGADERAVGGADVIDMKAAGAAAGLKAEQWAAAALPFYRHHIRIHGVAPNAPQLAEALAAAGVGALGKSRARDVRAATERLHQAEPWDDEAEAVNR